jgi:putative N6-adenine-specific DNA methylase
MSGVATLRCFAITAPGLEQCTGRELQALGIAAEVEGGGVAWTGDRAELYSASLHLRTASRVLVRIASFRARTFFELERHAARVPWAAYLPAGRGAVLRVTSRKSRLYHQRAIEERLARAIEQTAGATARRAAGEEEGEIEDDTLGDQLFVVRFFRDECVVSVDASGELLHRRGYRQAVARAPLRETIAAAMILGSDWSPDRPLLDPFCGSGTIPIEAALLARRIPPGLATSDRIPRQHAFQHWPDFEPALWERVVERARAEIRPGAGVIIQGSDRDAGAIEAAFANAARAGVEEDLDLEVHPLSSIEPPAPQGWLVTNPPYGLRVRGGHDMRDLYAALGRLARERLPGWTIAMLSADENLDRQTGLDLQPVFRTSNGGIPVRLVVGAAG